LREVIYQYTKCLRQVIYQYTTYWYIGRLLP
jgi:hypothetical protein